MKRNKNGFRVDLQVHLMLSKENSFKDLLNLMVVNNVDAVAVLEYDWNKKTNLKRIIKSNKEYLLKKKKAKEVEFFGNGFHFKVTGKDKFIILGKEIKIEEHHFLAPGVVDSFETNNLKETVDKIWEKGGIPIFDHPFADPEKSFGKIGKEKKRRVLNLVLNKKVALEHNGYCIKWIRWILFRDDPNKKILELGKKYNLPVIPTTDLHAESKKLMRAVGTGLIEIPKDKIDLENILPSIRKAIFNFDFIPYHKTVSFRHFLFAFGLPYLRQKSNQV